MKQKKPAKHEITLSGTLITRRSQVQILPPQPIIKPLFIRFCWQPLNLMIGRKQTHWDILLGAVASNLLFLITPKPQNAWRVKKIKNLHNYE
jgi:hypothetical protein